MQRIDFDRDGWKVEVRDDDGLMQIIGRSGNTRYLLLHIVTIDQVGIPGQPAIATNSDGTKIELFTAAD